MSERVNPAVNALARASAQAKTAADYEALKDIPDQRNAAQIQQDIERVREELTATVDELAGKLAPDQLKADLQAHTQRRIAEVKVKARNLLKDVQKGDKKACGILAGAAGVVALLVIKAVRR